MDIQVGDKCSVPIGFITRHCGICVGYDDYGDPVFVHNTYRTGRVTYADLADFSSGRRVRIDQRAKPGHGRRVARRAESLLGRRYDFVRFNCEHTANYAANGSAYSDQIVAAGVVAGVTLVVGAGVAIAKAAGWR